MSQVRSYSALSLTILALTLFTLPAWADWPAIAPEDLKLTDLAQQKGAPAVVLRREEEANDPQNYHSVYMRIKILTEAGRRYADVEIPYLRRHFRVDGVSGRTVHPDGSIVEFNGKVFDKMVVKERRGRGQQVRVHVKSFTLPDVQVGSILDVRYTLRYDDHLFAPPEWMIQTDLFQKSVSFKFTPYSGDLIMAHDRVGRGSAWTSYLPKDAKPEWHRLMTTSLATRRTPDQYVDLSMNDVPALIDEPFMPPAAMLRYRVQFYYTVDPASLEVESLPNNDSVKLDYAIYSTMQKQESANSIVARRDLVMGGLAFPANMYKEIKGFYDKVKVGDDEQMILKGSAHAEVK